VVHTTVDVRARRRDGQPDPRPASGVLREHYVCSNRTCIGDLHTQRQVSTAIAVSVLGTVLSAAVGRGSSHYQCVSIWFFALDAAMAFLGGLAALRINDGDAVRTMRKKAPEADLAEALT